MVCIPHTDFPRLPFSNTLRRYLRARCHRGLQVSCIQQEIHHLIARDPDLVSFRASFHAAFVNPFIQCPTHPPRRTRQARSLRRYQGCYQVLFLYEIGCFFLRVFTGCQICDGFGLSSMDDKVSAFCGLRSFGSLFNALWTVCFFTGANVFTVCFRGYAAVQ